MPFLLFVLSLLCFTREGLLKELQTDFVADVLHYENRHNIPAYTTALGMCSGGLTLLQTLSEAGILARVIKDVENSQLTLKKTADYETGDRMIAGERDNGRGIPNSFILDLNCNGSHQILFAASKLGLFRSPYRWLLINDSPFTQDGSTMVDRPSTPTGESVLSGIPLRADSQVTMAGRSANAASVWVFRDFYRAGPNATVIEQPRGQWTNGVLSLAQHSSMVVQRDLQGYPVGAAFVVTNNDSLSHLTDGIDRHIDIMTKATFDNVITVLQMINSTPFVRFVDTWGYTRVNGSWQGMIGQLQRGEVDVGGTGSMPIALRMDAQTYLAFTTPVYGIFLFRAPPISYEYNLFALPFATSVWACSACVLSLCCILLFPVMAYEGRKRNYNVEGEPDKNRGNSSMNAQQATLADVLLCGFAAICQQGSTVHAHGIPSRIITLWLHLCVICLYTSYTASIVVLLQTSGTSIHSLHDMWKSAIGAGTEDAPYNTFFFKNSTDPVRRGIYREKMFGKSPTNNIMTLEEGVDLTRSQFFAFHSLTHNLYYMIALTWQEEEKCGLIEFDNYMPNKNPSLSVRRNSPYEEMIRLKFALIYERGNRDRLLRRMVYPRPKCPPNMVRFSSVSVTDVVTAFQIFGVGVSVSILVLTTEILLHRCYKHRKECRVSCFSM